MRSSGAGVAAEEVGVEAGDAARERRDERRAGAGLAAALSVCALPFALLGPGADVDDDAAGVVDEVVEACSDAEVPV